MTDENFLSRSEIRARNCVFKHFIRKKVCFSHEYDNINIEEEKYFEESELLENVWLTSEKSFGYMTYCEWLNFKKNFDFILQRHRDSARCNCIC